MIKKNIEDVKKFEGPPKVVKIFSDKEIQDILELYNELPITVNNKAQNVIKKRWLQNFNKSDVLLSDFFKISSKST